MFYLKNFIAIALFSYFGILLRVGLGTYFGNDLLHSNIAGIAVSTTINTQAVYYDFFANFVGSAIMGIIIHWNEEDKGWTDRYARLSR
jgi:hypothetical protein